MAARHTQRQEQLSEKNIAEYLRVLCDARRKANDLMAIIRPFGDDYKHLMELTAFIDKHQERYTGNPTHFYLGAHSTRI